MQGAEGKQIFIERSSFIPRREHTTKLTNKPAALFAGTVEASLNLNNPIGNAEQISIGIEHGTMHTNVYSVAYTHPKPWGLPAIADLRLHQLFSDREPWSSYVERMRGGIATISR